MPNEITAQELAAKAVDMFGEGERVESWLTGAQEFLILTRAHAALQAQPAEAPGPVRCWMTYNGYITNDPDVVAEWEVEGIDFTPGHFTPDTEAHDAN